MPLNMMHSAEGRTEHKGTVPLCCNTLVKTAQTANGTYTYTYDNVGNITSVNDGTYTVSYEYDSLNQLVRENDQRAGVTYTYSYVNGNITEKKEYEYTVGELGEVQNTLQWTYGDGTWSDLLTGFDEVEMTYDAIGNMITIGDYELTWCGRQLQFISDGRYTYSYRYNADGQRVSKDFNGTTTEFFYNGSILAGQKCGNDTIVFMYDNNGDIFGLVYNGTEYYYIKNAQNDVVALADSSGTIIANYYYDAWGRLLDITGDKTIAKTNPILYRSYYYDYESGFYYLNSRYYSADICRFLNADGIYDTSTGMLSYNMFAYCNNNPVNMIDSEGTIAFSLSLAIVAIAIASIAVTIFTAIMLNEDVGAKEICTNVAVDEVSQVAPAVGQAKSMSDYGKTVNTAMDKKAKYAQDVVNAKFAKDTNKNVQFYSCVPSIFSDSQYNNHCYKKADGLSQHTRVVLGFSIDGKTWNDLQPEQKKAIINSLGSWDMGVAVDIGKYYGTHGVFDLFL